MPVSVGNPVVPSAYLTSFSVLMKPLPLPVPVARRRDGRLPQQPVVRLNNLKGRVGDLYAVRVAVHDATRGTVLCSEVYLISGTQK